MTFGDIRLVDLPASTSQIWQLLNPYLTGGSLRIPWPEAVRIGRTDVGEVVLDARTSSDDWELLPTGLSLKVMMLRRDDRFYVRWGCTAHMKRIVGGAYHSYLLEVGEDRKFDEIKSGFLEVRHGQLKVTR